MLSAKEFCKFCQRNKEYHLFILGSRGLGKIDDNIDRIKRIQKKSKEFKYGLSISRAPGF